MDAPAFALTRLCVDDAGKTLLQRATEFEPYAQRGDALCLTLDAETRLPFTYMHDRMTKQTRALVGPWLSGLSARELKLFFPHCDDPFSAKGCSVTRLSA
mgnify:CR=1 FL=1